MVRGQICFTAGELKKIMEGTRNNDEIIISFDGKISVKTASATVSQEITQDIGIPKENKELLTRKIAGLLRSSGIAVKIKGYTFIPDAVAIAMDSNVKITDISMHKEIYPVIAKKHGTTILSVESGIRHSIKKMENIDQVLRETFGENAVIPVVLENKEFICALVENIRYNGKNF
jgi:hypothetical protein